jgi:signal transduction histidine kinase
MKFFRREVWSYAVLLIILFAIGAVAVSRTLSYLQEPEVDFHVVAVLIWTITLGFMLIAGAFGIWAIQFAAESESRRRVGLLVDAMDFLNDGLMSVNRQGQIGGANPAAKQMSVVQLDKITTISEAFPALTRDDVQLLLGADEPTEIERDCTKADNALTLRFRSQPSEGLTLILISDVTGMNSQRLRARQAARLQLVGQIAKGVANDFNNLLCVISGHASIIGRAKSMPHELASSAMEITQCAERGIALAGHLLELAQPALAGPSTNMLGEHVKNACQTLRDSLPMGWQVECSIEEQLAPVALPGIQIEQAVLNLALLASESLRAPGILTIRAGKPGASHFFNVPGRYACVVVIMVAAPGAATSESVLKDASERSGVILSVIRSMIEEAGGTLQELTASDGTPLYRASLPHGKLSQRKQTPQLTSELRTYIEHWAILLAWAGKTNNALTTKLTELNVNVEHVDNIISALARVEENRGLDIAIIDRQLLGQEGKALLRAIVKLRPSSGIVVLSEDPESERQGLSEDVVFAEPSSDLNTILTAMIEAKSLALKRHSAPTVTPLRG